MLFRILVLAAFALAARAEDAWLKQVEPILKPQEKARYLALRTDEDRANFIKTFWGSRRITAAEYARRVAYIDANYGSDKFLSGVNTDRGKVYLALGPPVKVTRLVMDRIFNPMEIWYYDTAADIGISYALSFIFFQRHGAGEFHLYSPNMDTIRALLNPEPTLRMAFGPNDVITAADIRNAIRLSPAEDEVVDAAIGVAYGITGAGNEEILGYVITPRVALSSDGRPSIRSRLLVGSMQRPEISSFITWAGDGTPVLDLIAETRARIFIGTRLSSGDAVIEQVRTDLSPDDAPPRVRYQQRFYLLPGNYVITLITDGQETPYPVSIPAKQPVSEILLGDQVQSTTASATPFQFGSIHLAPSAAGRFALMMLDTPQPLTWRLTQGVKTLWIVKTPPSQVTNGAAIVQIGPSPPPPGNYLLEVTAGDVTKSAHLVVTERDKSDAGEVTLSYNANLAADALALSIGKQYLLRKQRPEAKKYFEQALALRDSDAARVNLARVAAMSGDTDGCRRQLNEVLQRSPDHFEALVTMASLEAQGGNYVSAARYYERALAIQKSPVLSQALSEVQAKIARAAPR